MLETKVRDVNEQEWHKMAPKNEKKPHSCSRKTIFPTKSCCKGADRQEDSGALESRTKLYGSREGDLYRLRGACSKSWASAQRAPYRGS